MAFFQVILVVMSAVVTSLGMTHLYKFFVIYKRSHYKYLYLALTSFGIAFFIFMQSVLSLRLTDVEALFSHRLKIVALIMLVFFYLATIAVIASEKNRTAFKYPLPFFAASLCAVPFDFFLSLPVHRLTIRTPFGPFDYAFARTRPGYTIFSILLVLIFLVATILVARSRIIRARKFYTVIMMLPVPLAINDFLVIHGVYDNIVLSEYYFFFLLITVSFVFLREEHENQKRLLNINVELENRIRERTAELETAVARLLALATTDILTGLDNRQKLILHLNEERMRFERYGKDSRKSFSVVFMDLDDFKYYNDSFGHGAGDCILRLFAEMLRGMVRTCDIVARFGGDEFVIILPETETAGAIDLSARIHGMLASKRFFQAELEAFLGRPISVPESVCINCSMGIATYDPGMEIDSLLANADKALYAAKARGKHCFAVWEKDR